MRQKHPNPIRTGVRERDPGAAFSDRGRTLAGPVGVGGGALQRGAEDAAVVDRVLNGDTEAYGQLVERYQRPLYLLLLRYVGKDTTEAEDLTQDTFVRAYQYLSTLSDRRRFAPWLFRIARSLCRDKLRRKDTERRALFQRMEQLRLESKPSPNPLGSLLDELPRDQFQVLHMRYFEGLTYEEIARNMGLSFSKVDHLIRRARSLLGRKISRERERERAL